VISETKFFQIVFEGNSRALGSIAAKRHSTGATERLRFSHLRTALPVH